MSRQRYIVQCWPPPNSCLGVCLNSDAIVPFRFVLICLCQSWFILARLESTMCVNHFVSVWLVTFRSVLTVWFCLVSYLRSTRRHEFLMNMDTWVLAQLYSFFFLFHRETSLLVQWQCMWSITTRTHILTNIHIYSISVQHVNIYSTYIYTYMCGSIWCHNTLY